MNEKEAREIVGRVGTDDPPLEKLNKLSDMGSIYPFAKGYLEAIEKAKVLKEALEYIIEHQEYVSESMAEFSTTRRIAKGALAKWEKEK